MVPEQRNIFNQNFTEHTYEQLLSGLNKGVEGAVDFRVAETPVFLEADCSM